MSWHIGKYVMQVWNVMQTVNYEMRAMYYVTRIVVPCDIII